MKFKLENIIYLFLITAVIGLAISYSRIYLFHIVLVLLMLSFFSVKVKNAVIKINKLPTRLHYIFYFMLFWYILSSMWSIDISYTFMYVFYIICGLSIIITTIFFIDEIYKLNKTVKIIGITFIIEIILSLLEAFTSFRLPVSPFSNYLKYFGRNNSESLNEVQDNILAYLLGSPTGFRWNPNNLAVTMLIIFPFFLFHPNNKIKYLGGTSIFVLIVMSGSRGVFIAFLLLMLIHSLFFRFKKALYLLLISPFLFLFAYYQIDNLKKSDNVKIREIAQSFDILEAYLFDDSLDDKGSIGSRKKLIQNGLEALKDSYYIGVGGGNSNIVQERKGGVDNHYTSMHNFWIEMMVEAGVLFFLCFIIWYICLVFKLYSISKNTSDTFIKYVSSSLFLSLISFTIGAVSASSVIYLFPMWLMFGLSIATINIYMSKRHNLQ